MTAALVFFRPSQPFLPFYGSELTMCRAHVFVVLLALGSAAPLNAQAPLDTVLDRLRSGQTIRVRTQDLGRVEGRLLRLQDDALRVEGAGSPDISVATIDSLWVRRHATATGAIVGGLALGLIGYIVLNCSGQDDCPSGQGAVGAAVGFGGGALGGP